MDRKLILVVDDEPDLCQILKFNLEENGYLADIANSAEQALQLDLNKYNLILLDVMMEGISGFEMLSILRREKNIKTPVIFLTAMNSENNLLEGFRTGADDYIKKPFSIQEVLVRIKAVLERYTTNHFNNYQHQGIKLESSLKRVTLNNETIELTRTEYDIFTLLYNQAGKVYSREEITKRIWSDQQFIMARAVDVNITRIRKKFGQWGKCIVTRSGYGYYFDGRKAEQLG
ncbi:MAG TPA: DNA-binding response regulator [Marinilabiliales bacterium]|jgi:DNA-binding response OmpR family regulator|nr:response regulator transcription factor [Salinivirgaceae bacterium]OFX44699.1 MAG: DNA-binding response regulator [Bacteroidetes bacterium GWA2_40_14]OFX64229.1 MAG: DNA-binding response regulator [Bacteroidetes bacterium GWC2_40_13]OFX71834.1 MAG: DNA-binding response regulator [Bacteroidetes bacterium GWD2_40_43]OFX94632.1 MAG: DNA-binding response regulator [Bacteroidetes bacterium GWE2_40_63]OFY21920.1 MAG: DNA-binding response regulator [Bacteroidetes bacterium GWF2_40_13]OFZ24398.1 M